MKTPMTLLVLWGATALPGWAQDPKELEVAREVLTRLQPLSFAKRREYCGFIGYDARGELVASAPVAGTHARCSVPYPEDLAVTASYHTHGDFDPGYYNELPSDLDIASDAASLLNGYVSTPGGRLWFVDERAKMIRQICGIGCLPVAPGFYKGVNGQIEETYTFDALLEKLAE